MVLRYLGYFYGQRTPEPLFKALAELSVNDPQQLSGMHVEFYGKISKSMLDSESFRSLPADLVSIHAPVDYVRSLELMQTADILLVIDAPAQTSVFLPSKLVDYMGAGQPILGITPPGTSADLIRRLGGWVASPEDSQGVVVALKSTLEFVRAKKTGTTVWGNQTVRSEYHVETVANSMEMAIDDVIQMRQS